MSKVYYRTAKDGQGEYIIWSIAKSLTEAGKYLARCNKVWPEESSDGQMFLIGRKRRGRTSVEPTAFYRLDGDKLKLECRISRRD